MVAVVLDGKKVALEIEKKLTERVRGLVEQGASTPILATILVGEDPASATYVKMKGNACRRVGMDSLKIVLPQDTSTTQLLEQIQELNQNPQVHGILLQHPVPHQIDERICFDAISLSKDVDGVTAHGFGRMAMGISAFGSATPQGIMDLLSHYNIDLKGKHAVVVGRSPILGKPMALMLLNQDCTVTVCHSRTQELQRHLKHADLVVGAVGRPEFIQGSWIKDGAIVVDAGYHPAEKVGDIALSDIIDRCSAYTPVPGGVGPMTIATLMRQTLDAACIAFELLESSK